MTYITSQDPELGRIMKARSRLGSKAPGYAAIVFGLKLVEHPGIDTMATDGQSIFWNREFVRRIDDRELMGVLMHEGLHVTLGHHLRRGKINSTLWNVACDYAINIVVKDAREPLPKGALYDEQYRGFSAHQIVKKLGNDQEEDQGEPQQGRLGLTKLAKSGTPLATMARHSPKPKDNRQRKHSSVTSSSRQRLRRLRVPAQ